MSTHATVTESPAVAEMTTPALVREYASNRFGAGYFRGMNMDRTKEARDRQSVLVNELRRRKVLD